VVLELDEARPGLLVDIFQRHVIVRLDNRHIFHRVFEALFGELLLHFFLNIELLRRELFVVDVVFVFQFLLEVVIKVIVEVVVIEISEFRVVPVGTKRLRGNGTGPRKFEIVRIRRIHFVIGRVRHDGIPLEEKVRQIETRWVLGPNRL